jgi:hypothetical protein
MYRLQLDVGSEDLGPAHAKSFKIGNNFRVRYTLRNGGDTPFPGGKFGVNIVWPNGQVESGTYNIPALEPGQERDAEPVSNWGVLSNGYALFQLSQPTDNNDNKFELHRRQGDLVPHGPISFHSVLGFTPEERYQYWAMIVSAIGLVISAVGLLLVALRP